MEAALETNPIKSGLLGDLTSKITFAEFLLIGGLLFLFCYRIWGIGVTDRDDADWFLAAAKGIDPIPSWAIDQGRIGAIIAGPLLLYGVAIKGTVYGELINLGSFAAFFICASAVLSIYFGRTIAVMSAILYLSLFSICWEGSLLTAHPLFTWILGLVLLSAIVCARRYQAAPRMGLLIASQLLLLLSLFNHEGMQLLHFFLFVGAMIGNQSQFSGRVSGLVTSRESRRLVVATAATALLFAALSIAWRLHYPSHYDGHALALSFTRFSRTLFQAVTSGSVLYDLFSPYHELFTDQKLAFSRDIRYVPFDFSYFQPTVLIVSLTIFFVSGSTLLREEYHHTNTVRAKWALAFGLAIALIPMIPVAMTEKYQHWLLDLGVRSYGYAMISHFGISLCLSASIVLLMSLCSKSSARGALAAAAISFAIAFLGYASYQTNDRIVYDMRPEAARWRVLATSVDLAKSAGMQGLVVTSPDFRSGSWNAVVPVTYWTELATAKYGFSLNFVDDCLPAHDNVGYLSYQMDDDHRGFIVLIEQLTRDDKEMPRVSAIAIAASRAEDLTKQLVFLDSAGWHRLSLAELPVMAGNPSLRLIKGLTVDPTSVKIAARGQKETPVAPVRPLCYAS